MPPKISVIVPLYNKARYIERCLRTIQEQSFGEFEVIVVNDGSTDGSEALAAQFPDSRVRVVSQPNAGPGAARNKGVELAQSGLAAFLDADDAWHQDYLKESVAAMERIGPEVASVTWGMMLYPREESTEARWGELGIPLKGVFRAAPDTPRAVIIAMLGYMLPSCTVIRTGIYKKLGGFYAKYRCVYSEDAHLYLKLLLNYAAAFDSRPLTLRYEEASELAYHRDGARPVEPFLRDPEDVEAACPESLRGLLREVLARRALKTASVYGYWGESRQSRELVQRFVSAGDWRLPYFATAMLGCTPLGGWAGTLARTALAARKRS